MEEVKTKKCSKCGRELPMTKEYFHKDKAKCGFKAQCKECRTGKEIFNKEKEEFRICKVCNKSLPLNEIYFHKRKDLKGGFRYQCRECKKKMENEKYHNDSKCKQKLEQVENIKEWYDLRSDKFKNNWKFEDIEWMYNKYLNITKQELLDHFNNEIKYKTLTNIIYQWGLKKIDKNDDWDDKDIKFLIENYPNMPQQKLENRFPNRTWISIKGKASKLGINRDSETKFMINSASHKGIKLSEEARRKMSRSRKGENNHNWKGMSHLIAYFRCQLYEWKLDSLKYYNYNCYFTNKNDGDLEIHHVNKNFVDIIEETFKILNLSILTAIGEYSEDNIKLINDKFIELHYKYGLGVPISKYIHKTFHILYGHKNNSIEQFKEFENKYFNSELEDVLNEQKQIEKENRIKRNKKSKKKLLNKEKVIEIRQKLNDGYKTKDLSEEYGVTRNTILDIKNFKTWREVAI